MTNNWHKIWNNRNLNFSPALEESSLINLLAIDGFDTGFGSIDENAWRKYIEIIINKLEILKEDSIFEVGCGAGALLFLLYKSGYNVSGIDYSQKLVEIANKIMPEADISICEAGKIDTRIQFDIVLSNSVFFYFPDYDYAKKVLIKMIKKSKKNIAVLDIPDQAKKDFVINLRKKEIGAEEYNNRYKGLPHLYYDKKWFEEIIREYGFRYEICDQNIDEYTNNSCRYNVFIYK